MGGGSVATVGVRLDQFSRFNNDGSARPHTSTGQQTYDTVYTLNQHPRAILAAHLLGRRVVGPGSAGPLCENLPPWGTYLRKVARERSANHVHLADAFCGLCGVMPPGRVPRITPHASDLGSLEKVGDPRYHWVAVIIGAGDLARCLPPAIWARWITALLNAHTAIRVVLIGAVVRSDAAAPFKRLFRRYCGGVFGMQRVIRIYCNWPDCSLAAIGRSAAIRALCILRPLSGAERSVYILRVHVFTKPVRTETNIGSGRRRHLLRTPGRSMKVSISSSPRRVSRN